MAEPAHGGRFYTVQELARHDGTDASLPLLLSVQGIVFDVSSARDFYGPGGAYSAFAGKECSRALAHMSTRAEDCTGDVSDLTDAQKGVLREWEQKFMGKYEAVGMLQR